MTYSLFDLDIDINTDTSPIVNCYSHTWKTYVGLTDTFEYCDKCGITYNEYMNQLKDWGTWWGV